MVHFPPVRVTKPLGESITLWEREISLVFVLPSLGLASGLKGFDHGQAVDDLRLRLDESANQGLGHVAATNKQNVQSLER